MKKFKEKQKVKGKRFLMLLMLIFSIFFIQISCKKALKGSVSESSTLNSIRKDTVLSYVIYNKNIDKECENWGEKKLDVLKFVREFQEINTNEWHKCFGNFPCGIRGELVVNHKVFEYNLNAAGWMQLKYENSIKYFGSKNKKDTIFFNSIYYCDEEWGQ